ncbi:MAG TPA: protein kinase [Baekduia sp.]|nr:protein kinase [Baekduia sp.]
MSALSQQVDLPPRYRVVRHIANGGMATVWAAEDAVLERLVAVKVLAAGYAADPSARRRFTREARAAARVSDHLNVVTIFDTGDHDGQAFIVMEHFAGGSIADRLKTGDPIPVPLALRWLRETASALDAAHAADIVHRDVKPGNLLLDENGRLAVGDFGIASIAGETAMTAAGQILGTAAYLSPEQARGRPATPASDRYSLAVVAFELLCGRRPFDGNTPMAQARARVEQEPAVPSGPCAAAGDALSWGLAREPADRPVTAAAFVGALQDALGDTAQPTRVMPRPEPVEQPRFAREPGGTGTRGAVRREPPPEPVARQRSPHYRAFLLAGLTAACLVVGAGAALISDDGNNGGRDVTAPRAVSSKPQGTTPSQQDTGASSSSTTGATPATPVPAAGSDASSSTPSGTATTQATDDGRSAAAVNNAGYAMLPADPQGALPLLARAVEKFRAEGDTHSLDYAFSLYNYGWALRLAGRPAEAIPLLEERLQISKYKRGIVRKELKTAQQAAAGG